MKKNQPNLESLYAKVNKPSRNPTPPTPETEEVTYAEVSTTRGGRGQHPEQQSQAAYAGAAAGASAGSAPIPPRSKKDEITSKLSRDTDFLYGVAEVRYWSHIVYGDPHALNKQLDQILENPQQGQEIFLQIAESPKSVAKLAGRKALGIKSPDRKKAEDGFRPLCEVLERHVATAQKLHEGFAREQAKQQSQEKGESPETKAHKHHHHHRHHHHHAGEERHTSPQRDAQPRKQQDSKGISFAM